MKTFARIILLFIIAFWASSLGLAQNREFLSGWCEDGNQVVVTSSVNSTTKVQRSYPSCTVTVYDQGTTTLATIYSDYINTPKANPFTAAASGQWSFVGAAGRYDVKFSGSGITTPFTRSGLWISSATTDQISTPATITANQDNYTADGLSTPFLRLSSSSSWNITGLQLATQGPGDNHWLLNVGGNNLVLQNQNLGSTAANRFLTASGGDYTIGPNGVAFTVYDDTTQRWRTFAVSSLVDPGTNGIMVRTALNTIVTRTITGTANQIIVTNGDGVSGNPTLATPQDIATTSSPTFANLTLSSGGLLTINGAGTITVGNSGFLTYGTGASWTAGTSSTLTMGSGSAIQTGTGVGNTLLFRAFDTDTGPAYTTFATLTAGTTPTFSISTVTVTNLTLGGDMAAGGFSINNVANVVGINGASHLRTGTTAGNTLTIDAFDTDTGPAYTTFVTYTAGTTPTMVIGQTFQVNSTITGNANNVTLNLNAASGASDLTLGSTPGTIREIQTSTVGTRDLVWRGTPDSSAGFAIFEGATSAGAIVRTTGNTNPVVFQVNSVEQGRFETSQFFYVGNGSTAASPAAGSISATGGSGTNVAGVNLNIIPGRGTGTGIPGLAGVQYPQITASGTSLQGLTVIYPFTTVQETQVNDGTNVSNTTAETTILGTVDAGSLTVPAGSTRVGRMYWLVLGGPVTTTGTPTLTLRAYLGATVIASTGAVTMQNNTGGRWTMTIPYGIRSTGAAGTVAINTLIFDYCATNGGGVFRGFGAGAAGIDQTVNQAFNVTAQWSAMSASNAIGCQSAMIYVNR